MDKLIRSFARWLGGYSTLVFFAILALLFLGATLIIVITVLRSIAPLHLYELLDQFLKETPKYFSVVIGVAILAIVSTIFRNVIVGLQRESKDYARKISRRDGATSISASIGPLTVTGKTDNSRLRRTIKELREEIASLKDAPAPVDISAPEKLFQVARQRLLDEAVRIDSITLGAAVSAVRATEQPRKLDKDGIQP